MKTHYPKNEKRLLDRTLLRLCPFCGGRELEWSGIEEEGYTGKPLELNGDGDELIARWNRRTHPFNRDMNGNLLKANAKS